MQSEMIAFFVFLPKTYFMIKKIIAIADVHIRNVKRSEEYQKKLIAFLEKCREVASEFEQDEVRIVVAGDILHNKTDISPEAYLLCSWFLKSLGKIAKTIVIAGNHDISKNAMRLDPMSSLFSISEFDNVHYLDKETNYTSQCVKDDNITWCLFSYFDDFAKPNIDECRITDKDNTFVGLFHGTVKSARMDAGYQFENGIDPSYFDGIDFGILGHIHKRQCIKYNGIQLVYCGSLIQQDFGENLSKHGFIVWDVESCKYEEVDMEDKEYGFYNFSINSKEDIETDKEEIINL